MNLAKLTHSYHISLAEKQATKTRKQANLIRIASHLQQSANSQLLASIGDFLDA
jgi:hypothetical protein